MTQKNTPSFYAFPNSYYLCYITFKSTYSEKQFKKNLIFSFLPIMLKFKSESIKNLKSKIAFLFDF